MNESILGSIAKMIGIEEDYTHFDPDLVMCINTVFSVLLQLGVGPITGFTISDRSTKWGDFIGEEHRIEMVKNYMAMQVKLMFDPPLNSAVLEAMKEKIKEFEWRLNVAVDPGESLKG